MPARPTFPPAVAAILFFGLILSTAASAQTVDALIGPKDVFEGTIASPTDVDVIEVDGLALQLATVTVTAQKSSVRPSVRLVDASTGGELASADANGKKVVLKKVLLTSTGRFRVEVSGVDGSVGAYRVKLKLQTPKPLKTPTSAPSGANVSSAFDAQAGAVLGAVIRPAKGSSAVPATTPLLFGPTGGLPLDGLVTTNKSGTVAKIKAVELPAHGAYVFAASALQGDPADLLVKLKVRPPKTKKTTIIEPPEVSDTAPLLDVLPAVTSELALKVSGSGVTPFLTVRVEGGAAFVETEADKKGRFKVDVPLSPNAKQTLFVTAVDEHGAATPAATAVVTHDGTPPVLVIDFPADGDVLATGTTNVSGRVSDKLSGFMGLEVAVEGQPAAVHVGIGTNGTFDLGNVSLGVGGPIDLVATAKDQLGNTAMATVSVVYAPPAGAILEVVGGTDQVDVVGSMLAEPLVVRATGAEGSAMVGKPVTFEVVKSDGVLVEAPEVPATRTLTVLTDDDGLARVSWQLGSDAGMGNNRVRVTCPSLAGALYFCASATPDPTSTKINVASGATQVAPVGGTTPELLSVWTNDGVNALAGLPVQFDVTSGGGLVEDPVTGDRAASLVLPSGLTGHVAVRYIAGESEGPARVEATLVEVPGSAARFDVRTVAPDALGTRVSGTVRDNALQGLGGAVVSLVFDDGTQVSTATDVTGRFQFDGLETSGVGHVVVDGPTATTLGGDPIDTDQWTFPELAQELFVIAQADNVLPRPILLPPIDPDTIVLFDGSEDVELTMPALDGLVVTVPAGTTVTRTDGTIVGTGQPVGLSISPVHVDDIPMPLPDGASAPLAWTLQPGGTTFDPPLPITLPNMSGLAPGAQAYILVFDHDTGRFEIVAPAEVTGDGLSLVSVPGTGIAEAGWGGLCPPYPNAGDVGNMCPASDGEKCMDCSQDPVVQALVQTADADLKAGLSLLGKAVDEFQSITQDEKDAALVALSFLFSGGVGTTVFFEQLKACALEPTNLCKVALLLAINAALITLDDVIENLILLNSKLSNAFLFFENGMAKYTEGVVGVAAAEALCAKMFIQGKLSAAEQALVQEAQAAAAAHAGLLGKAEKSLADALAFVDLLEQLLGSPDDGDAAALDGDEVPPEFAALLIEAVAAGDQLQLTMEELDVAADGAVAATASVAFLADHVADVARNGTCTAEIGGRIGFVDPFGEFTVQNVPLGSPLRVTVTCEGIDETFYAQSEYVEVVDQGEVAVGALAFSTESPVQTLSIDASLPGSTLTAIGQEVTLDVTAYYSDGSQELVSGFVDGVLYQTTGPDIVSISAQGVARAESAGVVFLTATKDGSVATAKLTVAPGDALTTVQGTVVDAAFAPVAGATVTTTAGLDTLSAADGTFVFDGHPTAVDPLRVDASKSALFGFSLENPLVHGGVTRIGSLVVDVDTDHDGLPDWYEVNQFGTDPGLADTDGDGLSDNVEVLQLGSNPNLADTDGDGFDDALELALGSDLLVFDAPTTLMGEVTLPGGTPADGAQVTVAEVPGELFETTADAAGLFTFSDPWPAGLDPVTLRGAATSGATDFLGLSEPTATVPDGLTFVGPFELVAAASGPLYPARRHPVVNAPTEIGTTDANQDGLPDLVAAGGATASVLIGTGGGDFATGAEVALGFTLSSLVVADIDQDGIDDLLTTHSSANEIGIQLGVGDGTYVPGTAFATSGFPSDLAVADVDQDGVLDLVVANDLLGLVSVHLGLGGGAFAPALTNAVGTDPKAIAVGDLDVDGALDIVTANRFSDVSVLLGTGTGTFAPASTVTAGTFLVDIAVADLNVDGLPDLVVSSETQGTLVFYGSGGGAFFVPLTVPGAAGADSLTLGDVDGDGALDLVLPGGDQVKVLLGLGTGQFGPSAAYESGDDTTAAVATDLDGDGVVDLAVVSRTSDDATVLLADAPASFGALKFDATNNARAAVAADFDQDGVTDVAVAGNGETVIMKGAGDGSFIVSQSVPTSGDPEAIVAGDLDQDGDQDLVVTTPNQLFGSSGQLEVLLGDGAGSFAAPLSFVAGDSPQSTALGDFDQDGVLDLAVASLAALGGGVGEVLVLPGAGNGTYGAGQSVATGGSPSAVEAVDVDLDGQVDLVVTDRDLHQVTVYPGQGGGAFGAGQSHATTGSFPVAVAAGDFDQDGVPDLAIVNRNSEDVSILLGTGAGQFAAAQRYGVGRQPESVALGDVDGDGVIDVVVGNAGNPLGVPGDVSILLGVGDGTFEPQQRFIADRGVASIGIVDVDLDGRPDLIGPSVTFGRLIVLLHD